MPATGHFMRVGRMSSSRTQGRSQRRRGSLDRRSNFLLPIDIPRVKELLVDCAPSHVARLTKIDRRQIRRLANGALLRTHTNTLCALADWRGIPVEQLVADPGRSAESLGRFTPAVRAYDFVQRWVQHDRGARTTKEGTSNLQWIIGELLSYDAWTGALYNEGSPIIEVADADRRSLRRELRRLQDRRVRFANKVADALGVLLEPLGEDRRNRINIRQSALIGRQLYKLTASLELLGDCALRRIIQGPATRMKRITELLEFPEKAAQTIARVPRRRKPPRKPSARRKA
jgi:hypothetical protein